MLKLQILHVVVISKVTQIETIGFTHMYLCYGRFLFKIVSMLDGQQNAETKCKKETRLEWKLKTPMIRV